MIRFVRWIIQSYRDQFQTFDPHPFEFFLASISSLWGLWLLNPYQESFLAPTYALASRIISESVVGLIFFIHGVAQLLALRHGGWKWRVRMATTSYTLWFTILVVVAFSNPASTLVPLYTIFVLLSANVALRVRHANDYDL